MTAQSLVRMIKRVISYWDVLCEGINNYFVRQNIFRARYSYRRLPCSLYGHFLRVALRRWPICRRGELSPPLVTRRENVATRIMVNQTPSLCRFVKEPVAYVMRHRPKRGRVVQRILAVESERIRVRANYQPFQNVGISFTVSPEPHGTRDRTSNLRADCTRLQQFNEREDFASEDFASCKHIT